MPRVTTLQTNFTAGEISPKLYGRVDISRYQNGLKQARNVIPQIYGGGRRRDGSMYVAEVKTIANYTRLIPFAVDGRNDHILEFGELYVRVWTGDTMTAEFVSPYTSVNVRELDYTQGADTMFLFHQDVAPHKLVRTDSSIWTLSAAVFVNEPFEEPGSYPAAALTPSAKDPVGASITLTASVAIWSAGDVGSSVKINGGIVRITGFTSTTIVAGVIKQELTSTTAAPADAWSLHAPAWSVSRGYPRTGTLYEQRLVCGGSPTFPQTVWGSVTGAYLDFGQGVADDDAYAFTIASDIASPILYLASGRSLIAFTSTGEFTISGGLEKPLAPTNAQIRPRSNYGSSDRVRPVRLRDLEFFVQRAERKVRTFGYNISNDDWTAPDVSVLAEHLTDSGIRDICWQQEPESIVWMVRGDGKLVSITYDKDQDVTAWALHDVGGEVESAAVAGAADGDIVWLVVQRTINGTETRYLERFMPAAALLSWNNYPQVRSDCAIILSADPAATVWAGLSHLEGEAVDVVADGAYAGRHTVTGGEITIGRAASQVVIGLPYTSTIECLAPEIQTGMGSASGNAMRTSEVTVRFHETTGCEVNGKELVFRTTGAGVLDQPPEVFSGVKRIETLGWERGDSPLTITQGLPMPFHVLAVTRKFTVNDG